MQKENMRRDLTVSALLLMATVVMAFFADWLPFGGKLLLQEIPVLLCGLIAGAPLGALVGLLTPFLSFLFVGEPVLFPDALALALEYALFGAVAEPIFRSAARGLPALYASLLAAMTAGRLGYFAVMYVIIELQHTPFSLRSLLHQQVTAVWMGILLQLILIPLCIVAADRVGLLDDE